ncbi:unnamed protein product [Cladocopium goreaui]|uniref:Uncharacterized protein n=1 Tax=Cladocopium goreaui TaxID=2562237 RepID=A0A9P1BL71_9DINO|nr:unnamed protein product [Cladocopium goreaui]
MATRVRPRIFKLSGLERDRKMRDLVSFDIEGCCGCSSKGKKGPQGAFDALDESALLVDQRVDGPASRKAKVYPSMPCWQVLLLGTMILSIIGLAAGIGYLTLHKEAEPAANPQCPAKVHENCPAEWLISSNPGGYHCLQKLARQTSETAYEKSEGACRPKSAGPFPKKDCHKQCSIGNV